MSKMSKMVFVAFMQHCMQSTDFMSKTLKIQWPLAPPGGKGHCSCTIHPVGLVVHHQSVKGSSFVKFLGLVKLQE